MSSTDRLPDAGTLSRFRARLMEGGRLATMFEEVDRQLGAHDVAVAAACGALVEIELRFTPENGQPAFIGGNFGGNPKTYALTNLTTMGLSGRYSVECRPPKNSASKSMAVQESPQQRAILLFSCAFRSNATD